MSFAGDGTYVGISGQRPTAGIGSGTRFIDRATGDDSYFDGSVWKQTPRSVFSGAQITGVISGSPTFNGTVTFSGATNVPQLLPRPFPIYTVFRSGDVYYSQHYDGLILTSESGNPANVIQNTFNAVSGTAASSHGESVIFITDGFYPLVSGFAGWDVRLHTRVEMGARAIMQVPTGYSGHLFRLKFPSSHTSINGGLLREGATGNESGIRLDWDAIKFESIEGGVYFNNIGGHMRIERAGRGIVLTGHTSGWINSNHFTDVEMWHCKRFIDMDFSGYVINSTTNTFRNIECQSNGNVLVGAKIMGDGMRFDDVKIWDVSVGASGDTCVMTIVDPLASNTIITGGIMTLNGNISAGTFAGQRTYQNSGSNTRTMDLFSTSVPYVNIQSGATVRTVYTHSIDMSGTNGVLRCRKLQYWNYRYRYGSHS